MFEFTEAVKIDAPASEVWEVLQDLEGWWPASNPEHESLERLDDLGIEVGARIRIREKIAGIRGEAIGTITRVHPGSSVTWETSKACYRWFGVPITIGEGVTWTVTSSGDNTRVSAHVWATFPSIASRLLRPIFIRLLSGIENDREHTRIELRHLKRLIESGHMPAAATAVR